MLPRPLPLRRALRGFAATLVAAALMSGQTGPATAAADGPGYQQPAIGECRDLTVDQAVAESNSTAPVDCATGHTARVIAIARLPKAMTWQASAADLYRVATKTCQPALDETLGRTAKVRHRSAYTMIWFVPTKAQRSHGARWIRCDVALLGGKSLAELPTDATPALTGTPLPDEVARCLTATDFYYTTCSRTHQFRASGAFTLSVKRYPSERRFQAAAERRCPSLVSSNIWRWTSHDKVLWKLGDHTVVCYTRTKG